MIEEWRAIPGFESYYQVSSFGNIRSLTRKLTDGRVRTGRNLSPTLAKSGHLRVRLCKGNKHYWNGVHRIVAETFIGPCPAGMQCAHNDGNPSNNHAINLRWDTIAGNAADRRKHGTQPFGEGSPNSKLTNADVTRLWDLHRSGRKGFEIAAVLGCTPANVSSILNGKTWGHMPCR